MTDPASPREEFEHTLTQIATYLTVAGSLALMMSFAYESAKSYSLDPTADVIGAFTLNDLVLALRHWLPLHLAWWLLGGFGAFLGARRKLSGLPLLAVVLGSCIGADGFVVGVGLKLSERDERVLKTERDNFFYYLFGPVIP